MLAKSHRLPAQIRLIPHLTFRSQSFIVKGMKTTSEVTRFGFIISKKVAKNATDRNRIRRQFISLIEEMLPQIKHGYDILFIVQPSSSEAARETLRQELLTFLQSKQLI